MLHARIIAFWLAGSVLCTADDHYSRAFEIYKGGPTKAPEVLAELNLELSANPGNTQASILKAITEIGTDQFDEAHKTLDAAEKQVAASNSIQPEIPFQRARCFFFQGKYKEAKKTLEPFSGFFLGNKDDEARYDKLLGEIEAQIKWEENGAILAWAAEVVKTRRTENQAGFIFIPINAQNWATYEGIAGMGSFLKVKKRGPDDSAVLITRNEKEDPTYCVYFHGQDPTGIVEMGPKGERSWSEEDIRKAYQDLPQGAVKRGTGTANFTALARPERANVGLQDLERRRKMNLRL